MIKQEKIITGQKISYVSTLENDEKPILVFLHGWGAKLEVFLNIYPKNFSYIALDFPGFGNSAPLEKAWNLHNYAAITAEWIQKIIPENRKIILVGHSFGGRVIVKMIQEKMLSGHIQKIIFIGVPFYRKISWWNNIIGKLAKMLALAPVVKNIFRKIFYAFSKNSDYESLGNNEIMKETFRNIISEDISVFLPNLQNYKIDMLWGENDKVTPLDFAKNAQKILKTASLVTFQNAAHLPFLDQKEEFVNAFQKSLG